MDRLKRTVDHSHLVGFCFGLCLTPEVKVKTLEEHGGFKLALLIPLLQITYPALGGRKDVPQNPQQVLITVP